MWSESKKKRKEETKMFIIKMTCHNVDPKI